jgi:hypothetical protein
LQSFQPPGKPGYVLDFSDRTFATFFSEELNVDIDDPEYAVNWTSKLRRFKCFLQRVDKPTAIRTLKAMWEYGETQRARWQQDENVPTAQGRFLQLIARLEGGDVNDAGSQPKPAFDRAKFAGLQAALTHLSKLDPAPPRIRIREVAEEAVRRLCSRTRAFPPHERLLRV